jgi:hypothetical protein
MAKTQRVPRIKTLFESLVSEFRAGRTTQAEFVISTLGMRGRIVDVTNIQTSAQVSDDTRSMIYVRNAIASALRCPICDGILDPVKSVSYDHITPVRDGGGGSPLNVQMAHPFCNTGYKEHLAAIAARATSL